MTKIGLLIIFFCALTSPGLSHKTTGYHCVNSYATLQCSKDHVIFVSRSEHRYSSGQCFEDEEIDYNGGGLVSQAHCLGVDESCEYYSGRCNGLRNCNVKIEKRSHQVGVYGGNCNFDSNVVNVYYTCVPCKLKLNSFCYLKANFIYEF